MEEERRFLNENYEAVFSVVYDRFLEKEEEFKRGDQIFLFTAANTFQSGKKLKDILSLFNILKKMLIHLSSFINSRWQVDKISKFLLLSVINNIAYAGTIIEKGLYRLNHPQLRSASFELLLYFIEALQNSMEAKQIDEFATAINLEVFFTPNEKVVLKSVPKPGILLLLNMH